MPSILLVEIDNRLIHRQVGITWTTSLGANLIVIADDLSTKDPLQQQLMRITAGSPGAGIRFFTIEKTINIIHKASPTQEIFIVCRTPNEVRALAEGGVPIRDVDVGDMHFDKGKRQISEEVYVGDKDLGNLRFIKSKGMNIFVQDVPGDIKENIR